MCLHRVGGNPPYCPRHIINMSTTLTISKGVLHDVKISVSYFSARFILFGRACVVCLFILDRCKLSQYHVNHLNWVMILLIVFKIFEMYNKVIFHFRIKTNQQPFWKLRKVCRKKPRGLRKTRTIQTISCNNTQFHLCEVWWQQPLLVPKLSYPFFPPPRSSITSHVDSCEIRLQCLLPP